MQSILNYPKLLIFVNKGPVGVNVVIRKWIYRLKLNLYGSLALYKLQLVLCFIQREGMDYGETFCSMVKPYTIGGVLRLSTFRFVALALVGCQKYVSAWSSP